MRYMLDVHYNSGRTKVIECEDRDEARRIGLSYKFRKTVCRVYFYDCDEDSGEYL